MYVGEWDMCWRNFLNFSLVPKKCEKEVKDSLLIANEGHFEIWFSRKENNYVFQKEIF